MEMYDRRPDQEIENFGFSLHSNQFLSFLFWLVPSLRHLSGFPGGSVVKNLRAMQETQEMRVWFLRWEDPLEEDTAAQSRTLAWRIPWTEEPSVYSPWSHRVRHDCSPWAHAHTRLFSWISDIFLVDVWNHPLVSRQWFLPELNFRTRRSFISIPEGWFTYLCSRKWAEKKNLLLY